MRNLLAHGYDIGVDTAESGLESRSGTDHSVITVVDYEGHAQHVVYTCADSAEALWAMNRIVFVGKWATNYAPWLWHWGTGAVWPPLKQWVEVLRYKQADVPTSVLVRLVADIAKFGPCWAVAQDELDILIGYIQGYVQQRTA